MEPFPFPYILFSVFFRCVSMRSVFVGWPQFPVRCVCSTTYTRVRCACVIYDYRSHYDVKSTTMCGINFRMCETITNKNTRMLISLSLNVYYPSRCLLFIFVLVFVRLTRSAYDAFPDTLLVCVFVCISCVSNFCLGRQKRVEPGSTRFNISWKKSFPRFEFRLSSGVCAWIHPMMVLSRWHQVHTHTHAHYPPLQRWYRIRIPNIYATQVLSWILRTVWCVCCGFSRSGLSFSFGNKRIRKWVLF